MGRDDCVGAGTLCVSHFFPKNPPFSSMMLFKSHGDRKSYVTKSHHASQHLTVFTAVFPFRCHGNGSVMVTPRARTPYACMRSWCSPSVAGEWHSPLFGSPGSCIRGCSYPVLPGAWFGPGTTGVRQGIRVWSHRFMEYFHNSRHAAWRDTHSETVRCTTGKTGPPQHALECRLGLGQPAAHVDRRAVVGWVWMRDRCQRRQSRRWFNLGRVGLTGRIYEDCTPSLPCSRNEPNPPSGNSSVHISGCRPVTGVSRCPGGRQHGCRARRHIAGAPLRGSHPL